MKGIEYRSLRAGSVIARTTVAGRYEGGAATAAGGRRWVVVLEDEVLSFRPERTGMISSCARGLVRGFSSAEVEEVVDEEGL